MKHRRRDKKDATVRMLGQGYNHRFFFLFVSVVRGKPSKDAIIFPGYADSAYSSDDSRYLFNKKRQITHFPFEAVYFAVDTSDISIDQHIYMSTELPTPHLPVADTSASAESTRHYWR